jgi:hypothetical protein
VEDGEARVISILLQVGPLQPLLEVIHGGLLASLGQSLW